MPATKFGLAQMKHPTPNRMAILFDLLASACGIISGFITSAAFISHSVSDVISSILTALIIPLLLLFKRFFGVEIEKTVTEIPIENVAVMEDKPDK